MNTQNVLSTARRMFGLDTAEPKAQRQGCFRCVTPAKCGVWGCCPGTGPSEVQPDGIVTPVDPADAAAAAGAGSGA